MIGIRREDKNPWERRVPLSPEHVAKLTREHGIRFVVEPSSIRVFGDEEYAAAGAAVDEDLSGCPLVLGVKEIPPHLLRHGTAYLFFAHVVKGQPHNMPMLRRLMELECTLLDYERITDASGKRLIFFGVHAGYSGMLDTLWALGQRLRVEGVPNPFEAIDHTLRYASLAEARASVTDVGERIRREGLPPALAPLVVGFAGYGNTYRGAAQILDLLPVTDIEPAEVLSLERGEYSRHTVYRAVFKESHTVEPMAPGAAFDLQDYYSRPERYRPVFHRYLPRLTVLVNCVYWESRFPRLVTKAFLEQLYSGEAAPRLRVIGDISCDVEGAVECTVHCTNPGNPVFVYDPVTRNAAEGFTGRGPVVLAVDNLPCELPRDASQYFGEMLNRYVPALARCDWNRPWNELALPEEIRKAVLVHRGRFTPDYRYLETHVAR